MPNNDIQILVTGSNGQLGSELKELSSNYDYNFFFTAKDVLDITNKKNIINFCETNNINIIINCAGYTAVDRAESDVINADLVNRKAVKKLAKVSKEKNIKLIHVSTDYVFNGKAYKPYCEEFKTNPISVYGKTKLDGELEMIKINPYNSIIIRTSWLYSSFGNNFVKKILKLGEVNDELGVVFDQIGTPTYSSDLARTILDIIPKINNEKVTIYHYSNEGVLSWYDFAKEIISKANLNCKINPIETFQYPTPALRPYYSLLNKSKIKKEFGIDIPHWKDSLNSFMSKNYNKNINILITGAQGFIAKNFILGLKNYPNISLQLFVRHDSINRLEELINKSDFIFHLAGEVRPNGSDQDLKESNVTLTKDIINLIKKNKKRIPILLTSSVHAKSLKNEYAKTKRDSELLVESYSKELNVQCFIYRLPHVFGENCKPNYNSVISTWIYNSINNLDIVVFDMNMNMNYVYVRDIVSEFIDMIFNKQALDIYYEPKKVFSTTLGNIVDYINEFKININNQNYLIINNDFKQKLFNTYKSYNKKGGKK
jgi:dTDP-4-dehydrorhamnose reductase